MSLAAAPPQPLPLRVLYDDNHVIAVFKPAGVLVQSDASGDRTLMDEVKAWLKHKYQKPGEVFLGLVHRIDKPVSGVVVFARTSKGAARLSEQIRTRAVDKHYRAWVEGALREDSATLEHWLAEDDGYVSVFDRARGAAKPARLAWRVLRREASRTLIEVVLETGRKHQIRAQLAHTGHPLLGDTRYGATLPWPTPGIALMSYRMAFKHPTQELRVEVAVPAELSREFD